MKYLFYFICFVFVLLIIGCFEMLEDIYFNVDGFGKYQIIIDMSDMFFDFFMGEMMKQGMKEEMGKEILEVDFFILFIDFQEGGLFLSLIDKDCELLGCIEMWMCMSELE